MPESATDDARDSLQKTWDSCKTPLVAVGCMACEAAQKLNLEGRG